MKEIPILMSGPMVRAIIEGRKTQTRRIVKPQFGCKYEMPDYWSDGKQGIKCPYGVPGDRIWVKETYWHDGISAKEPMGCCYRENGEMPQYMRLVGEKWKPSIFMPRWASRITLEIEAVRVERLIEISNDDAIAEGVVYRDSCWYATDDPKALPWMTASGAYRELWESINGFGAWDANPWVWVIQFRRITP